MQHCVLFLVQFLLVVSNNAIILRDFVKDMHLPFLVIIFFYEEVREKSLACSTKSVSVKDITVSKHLLHYTEI